MLMEIFQKVKIKLIMIRLTPTNSSAEELTESELSSDSIRSNTVERGVSTIQDNINIADANNNATIDDIAISPPLLMHTSIHKSRPGMLKNMAKVFDRLMNQL